MSTEQAQRSKLTTKQAKFVEFYIANGGNSLQAARAAGYSESTALALSYSFLENIGIQQAIQQRQAELAQSRFEVTPEWVMQKLAERAASKTSPSASVSALRTLADILGMTNAGARELPQHVETFLAFIAGELHGSQLSKPAGGKVIELPEARRATADSPDD